MRTLLIVLTVVFAQLLKAEDDLRSGVPKDCYLYSWGKEPNWSAKVSSEFRLSLLNRLMPHVDDQFSEPTEKALAWIERKKEPTVTTIASVGGRKVVQIIYPEAGSFGKNIGTVMLAMETGRNSEWFSPFFGAQPELYRGRFVSGRDVTFGYVATLEWSGTGAMRSHYLFDLQKPYPVIVGTVDSGRVVRNEYATDIEFEVPNKVFDREADLLSGVISIKAK